MALLPFRLRGREVSRLEGFSDAVFGFAATLLVVSLEVPRNYPALVASLRGFVPFAACFALLIWIWTIHNGYFRRYGMQDAITIVMNSMLLFVVLFFVYPMRVVLTSFVERVMWGMGLIDPSAFTFQLENSMDQIASLFAIYGAGFASIFICFTLLYQRAIRHAVVLELTEAELFDAKTSRTEMALYASVGLAGMLFGISGVWKNTAIGGWIYVFLGPLGAWWTIRRDGQRKRLVSDSEAALASQALPR